MDENDNGINLFENIIARADISLFEKIPRQTTIHDKRSLLLVQRALRKRKRSYVYLEIGSHLGGGLSSRICWTVSALKYTLSTKGRISSLMNGTRKGLCILITVRGE